MYLYPRYRSLVCLNRGLFCREMKLQIYLRIGATKTSVAREAILLVCYGDLVVAFAVWSMQNRETTSTHRGHHSFPRDIEARQTKRVAGSCAVGCVGVPSFIPSRPHLAPTQNPFRSSSSTVAVAERYLRRLFSH